MINYEFPIRFSVIKDMTEKSVENTQSKNDF